VTEKLGLKWALIIALLALTGWILLTPKSDGRGPINFGIDISGGTSLTYTVHRAEIDRLPPSERGGALGQTIDAISRRIDSFGTKEITVRQVGDDQIEITAPRMGEAEAKQIQEQMLQLGSLEFLIVIDDPRYTGATRQQFHLGGQTLAKTYNKDGDPEETFEFDPAAADAQRKEAYEKKVDVRGDLYTDGTKFQLREKVGETWVDLPVVWMPRRPDPANKAAEEELEKARLGQPDVDREKFSGVWLYRDPKYFNSSNEGFTGKSISDVHRSPDRFGGRAVTFLVDSFKQSDFKDYTSRNVGRLLAIALNDEVWSSPSVNEALSESVQIHNSGGGFTQKDQDWLVNCLQSGSLRLKPRLASQEVIGPSLGKIAVKRGVWAAVVSFAITILFMAWYYGFAGMVANLALLLNVAFTVGIVALFNATLTLPGIAGLLLTIGMAVDANILVFERTREELAKGKKMIEALSAGYDRAFITIFDSNLTTALTAALLIWHGTGPIKGFGVTLLAGIAVTMFTALFVTKAVFGATIRKGWLKELRFRETIKPVRYPFVEKSRPWIMASLVLCASCIVMFAVTGRGKYGLDFTGGTVAHVRFNKPLTSDQVRSTIAAVTTPDGKQKFEEPEITERDPIEGMPAAAAEYDVKFRASSDVDTREVAAFIAQRLSAVFGGPEGPPTRVAEPAPTDMEGEWRVEFEFATERKVGEVRAALDSYRDQFTNAPFSGARIEDLEATKDADGVVRAKRFTIDVTRQDVSLGSATQDLLAAFKADLDTIPFGRVNFIGPNVVVTLKESAVVSMTLAIIAIILYMWFRFKEAKYGIAASVALIHDVLVPLGLAIVFHKLKILDVPITLQSIAAYLTIIGFSINDTIVIFDRVRENLGTVKASYREIINLSLGQTLSRTILTSLTVFMVVLVLFCFNVGQDSPLEGFAFTMLLGVISGTYSTIFIACPLVNWLHEREEKRKTASVPALKTSAA
jgi:SecD/SecF fusion protein